MSLYMQPELDVEVSINEPLLSEEQLKDANLFSITVESLFSPPDTWGASGTQYLYTAAMPLPQTAEVSIIVSIISNS